MTTFRLPRLKKSAGLESRQVLYERSFIGYCWIEKSETHGELRIQVPGRLLCQVSGVRVCIIVNTWRHLPKGIWVVSPTSSNAVLSHKTSSVDGYQLLYRFLHLKFHLLQSTNYADFLQIYLQNLNHFHKRNNIIRQRKNNQSPGKRSAARQQETLWNFASMEYIHINNRLSFKFICYTA